MCRSKYSRSAKKSRSKSPKQSTNLNEARSEPDTNPIRKTTDFLSKIYNHERDILKNILNHLSFYDKLALASTQTLMDSWMASLGHDIRKEKPHDKGIPFFDIGPLEEIGKTFGKSLIELDKFQKRREMINQFYDIINEEIYRRPDRFDIVRFLAKMRHPILVNTTGFGFSGVEPITENNCDEMKYCRLLLEQKTILTDLETIKVENDKRSRPKTRFNTKLSAKHTLEFLVVSRKLSSTTGNGNTKRTNNKLFRSGIMPIIAHHLSDRNNVSKSIIDNKIEAVWILTNITFEAEDDWMMVIDDLGVFDSIIEQIDSVLTEIRKKVRADMKSADHSRSQQLTLKQLLLLDHSIGVLSNTVGHNGEWRNKLIQKGYHLTILRVIDEFFEFVKRQEEVTGKINSLTVKVNQVLVQTSWTILNILRTKVVANGVGTEILPVVPIEIVAMCYPYVLKLLTLKNVKIVSDSLWACVNLVRDGFTRNLACPVEFENGEKMCLTSLLLSTVKPEQIKPLKTVSNIREIKVFDTSSEKLKPISENALILQLIKFLNPEDRCEFHCASSQYRSLITLPVLGFLGIYSSQESELYNQVVILTGFMKFVPKILEIGDDKLKIELLLIISNIAAGTPDQAKVIDQRVIDVILTTLHEDLNSGSTGTVATEVLWVILNMLSFFDDCFGRLVKFSLNLDACHHLKGLLNGKVTENNPDSTLSLNFGFTALNTQRSVGRTLIDILVDALDAASINTSVKLKLVLDVFDYFNRILAKAKATSERMLRSDREIMLKLEKDLARSRFMQVSTKLAVMESTDVDVQRQYDRSVDIRLEYVRVNYLTFFFGNSMFD